MGYRTDIAVYTDDAGPALAVEVTGGVGKSAEWAAELREAVLASGAWRRVPFFLVATPDRFFLWKPGDGRTRAASPDYVVDAAPLLQPYYAGSGLSPQQMDHDIMRMVIATWLSLLQTSSRRTAGLTPDEQWVEDSGLLDTIRDGRLELEAAA